MELENGLKASNHPRDHFSDGNAYFAGPESRSLAQQYARHGPYEDGVLEIKIESSAFEKHFRSFEKKYQGGPQTELAIPNHMFELLNKFPRKFHPTEY
ncbi:hypothetical protein KKF91_08935 [Myxococcota bacterium]|nr:hypothetical protein [Myxococcota bacterium]